MVLDMRFKTAVSLIVLFLLVPSNTDARIVPKWDFEELLAKSTIVVLVDPSISRHRNRPDLDSVLLEPSDREALTMVETEFTIQYVLKGNYEERSITVTHAEATETGKHMGNGPNVPNFSRYMSQSKKFEVRVGDKSIVGVGELVPYFLFLVHIEGKYRFVTGEFDSVYSVKMIRDFPTVFPAYVTQGP